MRAIGKYGNYKSYYKTPPSSKENVKENKCQHKHTVALNEEGYAGVYCTDCGEQVEKEC